MSIAAKIGSRRETGTLGEDFAAQYLVRTLGWTVRTRNWRCRSGELDIVADDGQRLVVVEVRTRRQRDFGTAVESVRQGKVARLRLLTRLYVIAAGRNIEDCDVRIDLVALAMRAGCVSEMEHIRGLDHDGNGAC